jgi:two-component system chemotaxis sensor kinase CheA
MAVVKKTVAELGGTLTLESTLGRGTQFTLRLPLTLSIVETLIVSVGDQTCAIPQAFIEEIVLIAEKAVTTIKQTETVPYRDGLLPLVRLRSLFHVPPTQRTESSVLVVNSERGSTGLVVDRVHTRREVVVRPMRDPLIQVPGISGATELGDGRPVLILDALAITHGAVRPSSSRR